jgi:uncharacterized protein
MCVAQASKRLGLGVGFDMPWGGSYGFESTGENADCLTKELKAFLKQHEHLFSYLFVAFQPKNRNQLLARDYFQAYDSFFGTLPNTARAFHHTLLNMAAIEPYNKHPIISFTNELINRYNFRWVVEDLGVWSIRGKALPYPLPPFLTAEGLAACIANVKEYQSALDAQLCIEFPGFSEGISFYIGDIHAFDFFCTVARETCSFVTIDVGHVLSYQWLRGNKGERMFDGLERLPLDHCFELHLSGCSVSNGKIVDLHHGVLLDEQIELLSFFLAECSNLKAITYEDPKYTSTGALISKARKNFERLEDQVQRWLSAGM